MAYPTTLAFKSTDLQLGLSPITNVDTVQNFPLGSRAQFSDPTYGEIECLYLKGVASTAAGDIVAYDPVAGTTTRAVAATRGPMAVAMAATVANTFGWYAVFGAVPVNTTAAGTGAANSGLATTATAGQATVSGAVGQRIDGLRCLGLQDAPGTGFTNVLLGYPIAQGDT